MASATAAGLGVHHARRAHDPVLHLLLDVRLPAHRRLDLGDGRPARPRLPDRRHRRPDHAHRRGPAARRRPLPAAGRDQPGGRALRPGVRLRDQPHHAVGPGADVRRRADARTSSSTSPSTTSRSPSRPSRRTSTSRASCGASTRSPPPRARARASSCSAPASASRGSTDAARILAEDWGVGADTWSVTSWNELARDAVAAEEWNLLHPGEQPRTAYVSDKLADVQGPVVAVSDYMRAVPLQIARWVPGRLPRPRCRRVRLRRHPRRPRGATSTSTRSRWSCRRSRPWPTPAQIPREQVEKAFAKYRIDDPTAVADVKQEGGDA